jgi:hypothetical protein
VGILHRLQQGVAYRSLTQFDPIRGDLD